MATTAQRASRKRALPAGFQPHAQIFHGDLLHARQLPRCAARWSLPAANDDATPDDARACGASEGPLVPLPGVRDSSLLHGDLACESQQQSAMHLFLTDSSNNLWRHDPRLQLLTNTPDKPYTGSR